MRSEGASRHLLLTVAGKQEVHEECGLCPCASPRALRACRRDHRSGAILIHPDGRACGWACARSTTYNAECREMVAAKNRLRPAPSIRSRSSSWAILLALIHLCPLQQCCRGQNVGKKIKKAAFKHVATHALMPMACPFIAICSAGLEGTLTKKVRASPIRVRPGRHWLRSVCGPHPGRSRWARGGERLQAACPDPYFWPLP